MVLLAMALPTITLVKAEEAATTEAPTTEPVAKAAPEKTKQEVITAPEDIFEQALFEDEKPTATPLTATPVTEESTVVTAEDIEPAAKKDKGLLETVVSKVENAAEAVKAKVEEAVNDFRKVVSGIEKPDAAKAKVEAVKTEEPTAVTAEPKTTVAEAITE